MTERFEIISFYKFQDMGDSESIAALRTSLLDLMKRFDVRGTIILGIEGFNASICGQSAHIAKFLEHVKALLSSEFDVRRAYFDESPFSRVEVKIKPEIVTLRREVDISLGEGTHVRPENWNELISDPEVFVLDTRNDYEFRTGTFERAVNPETEKFSELPEFIENSLDRDKHKKVAMFCTGGIRCEKFAPYLKSVGFENVYQLEGGILRYLEEVPPEDQMWKGECYVFDRRISVDKSLEKGTFDDFSQIYDPPA